MRFALVTFSLLATVSAREVNPNKKCRDNKACERICREARYHIRTDGGAHFACVLPDLVDDWLEIRCQTPDPNFRVNATEKACEAVKGTSCRHTFIADVPSADCVIIYTKEAEFTQACEAGGEGYKVRKGITGATFNQVNDIVCR